MPAAAPRRDAIVAAVEAASIDYVIGVPDSGLRDITDALDRAIGIHVAPREDVAVGAAVGAALAGRRPLVYMKNAGLGTSLDALLSLARVSGMPLVLLVGWAGTGSDTLPHHVVMGRVTLPMLRSLRIRVHPLRTTDVDVDALTAFIERAYAARTIHAILVEP